MSVFSKKIKLISFFVAMLVSAVAGAFVALKFVAGTDLRETLLQQKIQENFSEKISRIRATQGDILELAVLESSITFEISDVWQNVPELLGKSVSRVNVPAVFRFFTKISEPISIKTEERNGTIFCTIFAPPLRPVLPVAFDTSQMRRENDVGLLRFNSEELSDSLQKKISMRLVFAAKNHAKSPAVRDSARKAFEKFALSWLREIRELRETPETRISIRVVFADEIPPREENQPAATLPVPVSI